MAAFKIYANGMSIAGQASGAGMSAAAFPDVCGSPPKPEKIGIPVPYPNTAKIKDLENGSTSVFMYDEPVALRDKSRIGTSTGNEPATEAFKKGVKTDVIKGKAYFTSWSPNVFVEGYNVPRHLDLMTHNHKS
ncbi:DUF4150 domain-containing protein [Massilia sp. CCM 8733]|uniref:DUF4150 domain-containing protein n=1 Tax=Massilia mucilaginosa TaxID=2609282 RepID=A0ABX0NUB1_9BURK|nr:DUF4150 domain-containing protein [Massilia mucilaginosa]NHZ90400.1 DUF4150 domain-containing protein [Massilia mucilaginosa]